MAAIHLLRRVFLIAVVCASATPSFALDPDRSLAQLHHTAWTAEDGAPSQISAIAQTADGYLWIGSARGLFRFDGVTFEQYVPPDSTSLPSHNVYSLATSPDGDLWISFRPFGVGHLSDGRLTMFAPPGENPATEVFVLACGPDGRVFAATLDGLFVLSGGRWVALGSDWKLPAGRVQTLFFDEGGTLWVASGGCFSTLAPGSTEFVYRRPRRWASKLSQAPNGWIWIAGGNVTAITDAASQDDRAPVIPETGNEVVADRDGCLWIATPSTGLHRVRYPHMLERQEIALDDPRIEWIRASQGLSDDAVHVLYEDREGNIWAGTGKGIDRFRHNHMVPVTLPDGYQALTLLPDRDGTLWVGSAKEKALLRVSAESVEVMNTEVSVASVYRGDDGVIWWAGRSRVTRQQGQDFRSYALFNTPASEWLWEVFPGDVDGALWVSVGDIGLYHFRDGEWEKRPPPAGLPTEGPSASYVAANGRTWLGYTGNRICVIDGDRVRTYTQADGIEVGRVRVIRGRDENIWVGGELGLAFLDGGRFHTVHCEGTTPFGTVAGIIATADGNLWLNELRGVVHIPAGEIEQFARDPSHRVGFRRYDVKEGLPGAGQMNWNVSTATEATDGKLWFATDGGLAWIDPARVTTNAVPPPVSVRSITTEDGSFIPGHPIRLRNNTEMLRIDYTAMSLSIPERVRFRYRLVGYDEQWVEAETRRTAFYTRLRPGSYRFQVVASNNDGVWNWTGATASFSIAPAFYQTAWFAAASLLAVLCSLWLLYRLRVRQVASRLQRLHDERMDERMRIAHELHDTLLQGFLSASMQLHVAREAIPADSSAKQQVGRVLSIMDGVIGDARLAVRGLRAAGSDELEHAFACIPQEAGVNGATEFRVVVNGRLQPLRATTRDEVYRIGRESIVNALRHAAARTIEAEITYLPRELRVVVRDDGRGIDADVIRAGRDGHWGLSGMQERATRMGGRLNVRSRPGAGTEVELVVPGRLAFVRAPRANGFDRAIHRMRARFSGAQKEE